MLEGRHVIGLFLVMLLFSGVFFALGYVMGRNEGQVRAAMNPRNSTSGTAAVNTASRTAAESRAAGKTAVLAEKTPAAAAPTKSDWEFYDTDKARQIGNPGKPAATSPSSPAVSATASSGGTAKSATGGGRGNLRAPAIPSGAYSLQVAAVRRESVAMDLASRLQKQKFPAFVIAPQGDRYYRVQVGPYSDKKGAEAAKKGLEGAGFRALVKRG